MTQAERAQVLEHIALRRIRNVFASELVISNTTSLTTACDGAAVVITLQAPIAQLSPMRTAIVR